MTFGKKLSSCFREVEFCGIFLGSFLVYNDFGKFFEIFLVKTEFIGIFY